jgi:hypothetical protein
MDVIHQHPNTPYLRKAPAVIDRISAPCGGKELPMIVEGREIRAQHDTDAVSGNFIARDLVGGLRLKILKEDDDYQQFSLGNRMGVQAVGRVSAVSAFARDSRTKMDCSLYVYKELVSPMIMGANFLEKAKTLPKFRHRLVDRVCHAMPLPVLNLIGSTQQDKRHLASYIDDRPTWLNADSGSDLDVMSLDSAIMHRHYINSRPKCRKRVQLADTTAVEIVGQVQVTLTMEDGSSYQTHLTSSQG